MNKIDVITEKFKNDNYARNFGIILDELTENTIKMHMQLKPDMNNFNGRPHGGAIYGLADVAFSLIGNNQNNISVALDCTINYHASPKPDDMLYVEGKLIKQTRKIGTYLFDIYTEPEGIHIIIATMLSTLYRTGKPHEPNLEVS